MILITQKMSRNSFPKQIRLLNYDEFVFVFQKQPQCYKITGIILLNTPNQLGYPRIGLAISKKYIKRAHERNRIKRYARETFRINQYNLSSSDFVLAVYSKETLHLKNRSLIQTLKKLWSHHFLLQHQ